MAAKIPKIRRPFAMGSGLATVSGALLLSLIPLSFWVGSYFELAKYDRNRETLQSIADKAALAGATTYLLEKPGTDLDRRISGEDTAEQVLRRWQASQDEMVNLTWKVSTDPARNIFNLKVMADSATSPVAFPFIKRVPIKVSSAVDPSGGSIEVALVLDNSSSLIEVGRFTAMRTAAKDYIEALFDIGDANLKVSVVPWAALVNINSEAAAPADPGRGRNGDLPVSGSRRPPPPPFMSRLSVLAEPLDPDTALSDERLTGLSSPTQWRGCIRASQDDAQASADGVVTNTIDDLPPSRGLWPVGLLHSSLNSPHAGQCMEYQAENTASPSLNGAQGGAAQPNLSLTRQCIRWDRSIALHQCLGCADNGMTTDDQNGTLNVFQSVDQDCSADLTSRPPIKTGVNAACLADPNEVNYIRAGGAICPWLADTVSTLQSSDWLQGRIALSGPNLNCPAAILPLSSNRRQVLDKLDELYPVPGGSQSDVGLAWALRTLSPRPYWTRFWGLADGQQPAQFQQQTRKIAVLVTNGRNEVPADFEGYYGCTRQDRGEAGPCWKAPNIASLNKASLDALTQSACQVMRDSYGIEVYVVITNMDDPQVNARALACAGSPSRVFSTSEADLALLLKKTLVGLLVTKHGV